MHRFFVAPGLLNSGQVHLTGDVAYQISRVLRMRPGDQVVLFDGNGDEAVARLTEIGSSGTTGEIVETRHGAAEPALDVVLYLALLNKSDKFEWALQKCTELGVAGIVPVKCERTVSGAPERGRRARWERILREAAEQSERTRVPFLGEALSFDSAVRQVGESCQEAEGTRALSIMLVPGSELTLRAALGRLEPGSSLQLFVGPEGGYTAREVELAERAGVLPVQLGPRILRAETAAVAALAVVMHELGEMGSPRI